MRQRLSLKLPALERTRAVCAAEAATADLEIAAMSPVHCPVACHCVGLVAYEMAAGAEKVVQSACKLEARLVAAQSDDHLAADASKATVHVAAAAAAAVSAAVAAVDDLWGSCHDFAVSEIFVNEHRDVAAADSAPAAAAAQAQAAGIVEARATDANAALDPVLTLGAAVAAASGAFDDERRSVDPIASYCRQAVSHRICCHLHELAQSCFGQESNA